MLLKKSKVLALYKILITKLLVLELKKFPSIVYNFECSISYKINGNTS